MPESPSHTQHEFEQEYHAIESALLETERGRWFLVEYSRRSRRLDDTRIEEALEHLKSSLRDPPALLERVRIELDAVAQVLEDIRSALPLQSAGAPGQLAYSGANSDLAASAGLLKAAEELHELIWTSRGQVASPELCEQIGRQATAMVALSARQVEESDQAKRFAQAIDNVLRRVMAVLESVQLEMGSVPGERPQPGSYALPDLLPLDSLLGRPLG